MTGSFNLTTEPWIPCERIDGDVVELSTREALVQAHQLRGIVDPSPLVQASLHRHLLAVLHRVYDGPRSLSQWAKIHDAGAFDASKVDEYLGPVSTGVVVALLLWYLFRVVTWKLSPRD